MAKAKEPLEIEDKTGYRQRRRIEDLKELKPYLEPYFRFEARFKVKSKA